MRTLAAAAAILVVFACVVACDMNERGSGGVAYAGALPESGETGGRVDPRLTDGIAAFGFDLLGATYGRDPGNTVVSPLSVATALSMTRRGAAGGTADQMAETLHVTGMSDEEIGASYANLLVRLQEADRPGILSIANSLWGADWVSFHDDFLGANREHFGAGLRSVDFATSQAAEEINAWVEERTEGKIEELVEETRPGDVLFLVNAVYFLADWEEPFAPGLTAPDGFTLADGSVADVDAMHGQSEMGYLDEEGVRGVRIPYEGGDVAMYVFLPKTGTVEAFVSRTTPEDWEDWMTSFEARDVALSLPRFETRWDGELEEPLTDLGMGVAFDPSRADFTRMTPLADDVPVWIRTVRHATHVRVWEEGTEAAAATAVGVTCGMAPEQPVSFDVDRPFLFAVRDDATGAVLFLGMIDDPTGGVF